LFYYGIKAYYIIASMTISENQSPTQISFISQPTTNPTLVPPPFYNYNGVNSIPLNHDSRIFQQTHYYLFLKLTNNNNIFWKA